ncbi:hypothetical protein [Pedobacter flavus]|uniref:DUF805 domain-containing protein n=1 Tax=Pedobacter flavus TaxID=3113906 RepID=A0ABU7GZX3_9SPHI|nr:hypothetical protein [Pedobacter sp. VNH31]MEE1884541.1 hypothetical protein [Pedobacter sp. VNH31]
MRIIYQVFYNFYAKDKEVDPFRWMSAGGLFFLSLFFLGINFLHLFNFIADTKVGFNYSKGELLMLLIPMLGMVFLYLLCVLKIERKGYMETYEKYPISNRANTVVWIFFWLNAVSTFIIPIVQKLELS